MERRIHLLLKAMAKRELESYGYEVHVEPETSPLATINWSGYRPDLLGHNRESDAEQIVLVECETNPTTGSILRKKQKVDAIGLQSRLDKRQTVMFLLVIPSGRLARVLSCGARKFWEVWLVNPCSHEIVLKAKRCYVKTQA